MATTDSLFPQLEAAGFDLEWTYHADAILRGHFSDAVAELDSIISPTELPLPEIVGSGGGEAKLTQRLRRALADADWNKREIAVEKRIDSSVTYATSHEVDHLKTFPAGTIALEIEWNNKDPFYDRDLEHFQRLHADGAISLGVIVTRGSSFQAEIESYIRGFAHQQGINGSADLQALGITRTKRQEADADKLAKTNGLSYADAWAKSFKRDKFASSTTHWEQLERRLRRGVGSPCPLVAIGVPIGVLTQHSGSIP